MSYYIGITFAVMPCLTKRRKQLREARRIKALKINVKVAEREDVKVAESSDDTVKTKPKIVAKKSNPTVALTRQQAAIMEIKAKEKEEKRKLVQMAIDRRTENRKVAKESLKRRRELNEKIHLKIRNKSKRLFKCFCVSLVF